MGQIASFPLLDHLHLGMTVASLLLSLRHSSGSLLVLFVPIHNRRPAIPQPPNNSYDRSKCCSLSDTNRKSYPVSFQGADCISPSQYPATYAHELAHLLGIAGEAEANFYAYQVCIRSKARGIRFSGYLSVLPHVALLMTEEEYALLVHRIRPEIIEQVQSNRKYWMEKYSPLLGKIQDRIYDWYLKGNNISSGRKNYSEVVGLLVSYYEYEL